MGVLGYRMDGYSLVDMRVHDVNVVADLKAPNSTSPNPSVPIENDGTFTGVSEHSEKKVVVEDTMTVSLGFINIVWTLNNFWPQLLIDVLSPDADNQPSVVLPPLISLRIDLLGAITVNTFTIYDFLIDSVGGDIGVLIGWIVEFVKDFIIVVNFAVLVTMAWTSFRWADGARATQQYYAMGGALAAGLILLVSSFTLVEGFHQASRELGLDDAWSTYFYLTVLIAIITSVFRSIPQTNGTVENALTRRGGDFAYIVMTKLGVDIIALAGDFNPVTGLITSSFIILTFVFFYVRFLTHLIATFS